MNDLKLGELITDPAAERDAVHVAVAPVVAAEDLLPGQHVGFVTPGDHEQVGATAITVGIVDPFLRQAVLRGERFWLLLYPQTITSLRHDWTHPAFDMPRALADYLASKGNR